MMEDVTEELRQSEKAVAAFLPKAPGRVLRFKFYDPATDQVVERQFVQETLGFVPMQQFFNRIRRELQNVMEGDLGGKLAELFTGGVEVPSVEGATGEDVERVVKENEGLIKAFFNLIKVVPDLELDIIAMSLGVHHSQADLFKESFSQPPSRGGATMEEGFDILRMFVRQNAAAVRRFFVEEATSLYKELVEAIGPEDVKAVFSGDSSTGGTQSSTSSQDTLASA